MIDYCHRALARLDLAAELPDDEALAEFREATEDLQAEGLTWAAAGRWIAAGIPPSAWARVNPGPFFLDLRSKDLDGEARDLLEEIEDSWLATGRLSKKEADVVAAIAYGSGITVSAHGIEGDSPAKWREVHRQKIAQMDAQLWAGRLAEIQLFLEEAEAGQAIVNAYLGEIDMIELAWRVSEIATSVGLKVDVQKEALRRALGGRGSRATKVALALLMGHPPSTLWPTQPDHVRRFLSDLRSGDAPIERPAWFHRADALLSSARYSNQVERERDDALYVACLHGNKAGANRDG